MGPKINLSVTTPANLNWPRPNLACMHRSRNDNVQEILGEIAKMHLGDTELTLWPKIETSFFYVKYAVLTSVSEMIRKPPLIKAQTAFKKIKYGKKRFSIWQIEVLHPAMWHDHGIDYAKWLHPTMWHVALGSWQWIHQVATPCNVIHGSGMTCHWIRPVAAPAMWLVALGSRHWIRQVAAPCNVAGGSGMTCHWIHPNVRYIAGSPPSWILGLQ